MTGCDNCARLKADLDSATVLYAETRAELDRERASVEWWKKDSAAAWDKCEENRLEAERLRIEAGQHPAGCKPEACGKCRRDRHIDALEADLSRERAASERMREALAAFKEVPWQPSGSGKPFVYCPLCDMEHDGEAPKGRDKVHEDDCPYAASARALASPPAPGAALRERVEGEATEPAPTKPRTCNRHSDCDAANAKAREQGRYGADHCHDDCCEDCFGT